MNTRASDMPEYKKEESEVLFKDKDVIRILRKDGTRAIGARTERGMSKMEMYAKDPYFNTWKQYRLLDGSLYLMEEVI